MSDAYETALQVRADLHEKLEKIEKFIELHEWVLSQSDPNYAQNLIADQIDRENAEAYKGPDRPPSVPHAKPAAVLAEVVKILEEEKRPFTRGQLLELLEIRGVVMGGTDKSKALGTTLWRARDQIVNLNGFGYWLKEEPYDPAGYKGDLEDLLG